MLSALLQAPPRDDAPPIVEIDGWRLPVKFRRHAQARRFILRVDPKTRALVVTIPAGASRRAALAFVEKQSGWIRDALGKLAGTVPFENGEVIPLRGENHRIHHRPGERGTVWTVKRDMHMPEICVAGAGDHLARRLADWLKREARRDIIARVDYHAGVMGLQPKRVSVRDQTSRWGSCSSNGTLSFSWRLILMPPDVLDYVAAHEVAHLGEMNHSPRFWALVAQTVPDVTAQKRWLRGHGRDMHRYGTSH